MDRINNIQQHKIYVEAFEASPNDWYFVKKDRSISKLPENDFYIPVFLNKTYDIYEYIDISKEDEIIPIQRQEINPYFIEFGFFDTIDRNRVNNGQELTIAMLNFIRIRRPDVATLSNNELKKWFNDIGRNEFPWNKGTNEETNINDIDRIGYVAGHIISKANKFNIEINR